MIVRLPRCSFGFNSNNFRVKAGPSSSHVYVEEPYMSEGYEFPLAQHKAAPIERWLEAQILPGDTLQAIALRFNCSVGFLVSTEVSKCIDMFFSFKSL